STVISCQKNAYMDGMCAILDYCNGLVHMGRVEVMQRWQGNGEPKSWVQNITPYHHQLVCK
ncbi:Unknown protein, partial [Striga hermonthica]